jgi:hypothetical protein
MGWLVWCREEIRKKVGGCGVIHLVRLATCDSKIILVSVVIGGGQVVTCGECWKWPVVHFLYQGGSSLDGVVMKSITRTKKDIRSG